MVDKRVEQNLRTSQMEDDVINVEFLDWLKKWGPNIIIAVALAIIIFQGTQWWIRKTEDRQSMAWADLANTDNVAGLLAVADENRNIGSVSELAWLSAAQMHYQTILNDKPIVTDALTNTKTETPDPDTDENDNADKDKSEKPTHLDPKDRNDLLDKMQNLYQNVISSTKDSPQKILLRIQAVFGMATVAEMKLDYDSATSWYEKAQTLTGTEYPKLTALAQARIKDMKEQDKPIKILTDDEFKKLKDARKPPELLQRPKPEPQTTDVPDENKQQKDDNTQQPTQDSTKNDTSKNDTKNDKTNGGSDK